MPPEAMHIVENLLTAAMFATTMVLIAFSPIARAIGNRIMHGRLPPPGMAADVGRVDQLSDEVAAMRQHLAETQERVDFTERLLAQARERGALNAPREV